MVPNASNLCKKKYRVAISKMNTLKQQLHHCLVSTLNLLMLWPKMIVFCLLSRRESQSHFRKFQGVAHCWDHETTFLPRLFLSKALTPWLSGAAKSGPPIAINCPRLVRGQMSGPLPVLRQLTTFMLERQVTCKARWFECCKANLVVKVMVTGLLGEETPCFSFFKC